MPLTQEIKKKSLEAFETFKSIYPVRNGRKLEMTLAKRKWLQYITPKDIPLILSATTEFANSREVKSGIGIMNAHRFIKDGKGIEHWRDWIPAKPVNKPPERRETAEQMQARHKDIKMRFSAEFQYKLQLRFRKIGQLSKRLTQLKHAPSNMW